MSTPPRVPLAQPWHPSQGAGAVIGGGAIAGAMAGAVMLAIARSWTAALGLGSDIVPRSAAAALTGPWALIGGSAIIWQGWLMFLAVAAVLGLIYTSVGWNIRRWRTAIIWGLLYGIGVWVVMTVWLLPQGNHVMAAYMAFMVGPWFVLHLIFGAVLSVSTPIRRGLAGVQPQAQPWQMPKAS